MRVLAGEAWSFQRYVENHVLTHCATLRTLIRFLVMLTACLDEGSYETACAPMVYCFTVAKSARKDPTYSLEWMWPILGVPDPKAKLGMRLSPIERARIMTFHREAAAFEETREKLSGTTLAPSPNPIVRMRQVQVSEQPSKVLSKPS